MEVRFASVCLLSMLFILAACSNKKTVDDVFGSQSDGSQKACAGQAIPNRFLVLWEDGHISVEESENAEIFKKNFIEPRLNEIKHADFDRTIHLPTTPDSSKSESSLSVFSGNLDYWGQEMTEVTGVWSQGVYGENVIVGVVDTVVDVQHPQLQTQLLVNTKEIPDNGIDDDSNGFVDDVYGYNFETPESQRTALNPHGSHVSGIILADHTKGAVKGLAPKAKLISSAFISSNGTGDISNALLALEYVASRGAKVVNASWGGSLCNQFLSETFATLEKKGVLIVVAAGNDSLDLDRRPEFPAASNSVNQITVAAATNNDFMAGFSNSSFNLVHLAAPGVDILSTVPFTSSPSGTASFDGTSMAAPFVTGAAALLWGHKPQATYSQIKQALLKSVDVYENHIYRVQTRGRLNIRKALEEIKRLVP